MGRAKELFVLSRHVPHDDSLHGLAARGVRMDHRYFDDLVWVALSKALHRGCEEAVSGQLFISRRILGTWEGGGRFLGLGRREHG